MRTRRPPLVDVVLLVVVLGSALPATFRADVDPRGSLADTLLLPLVVLPILLRRHHALAAAAAFLAGCALSALPTLDQFRIAAAIPAGLLIAYSVGAHVDRERTTRGLALVVAGLAVVGATDSVLAGVGGAAAMVAFSSPLVIAVWGAGRSVRTREQLGIEVAARSAQLEERRERTAALAIEVERLRLAGDLDDATRAHLTHMVALAERGAGGPEQARDTFARVEALGRETLDELRGLLGALRSTERGTRLPRPTLAELDDLLATARAGGRVVDLHVDGERRPLPTGVELVAYRAVQHALDAVAADRPVRVQLVYAGAALEVEVRGTGRCDADATAALAAARERVAVVGGTFRDEQVAQARRLLATFPIAAARA